MAEYAVRYTQPLLGAVDALGRLAAIPGASVLIRQDGVACDVFADNAKTPLANPVPTGVPPETPGVDTTGNLTIYLLPGRGYGGVATVGNVSTTFSIPDISLDSEEPIPAGTVEEAMLAFGIATQAELDTEATARAAAVTAEAAARAAAVTAEATARAAADTTLTTALAGKEPLIPPNTYVGQATIGSSAAALVFSAKVQADANARFKLLADGTQEYRDAASGALVNFVKMTASGHLAMKGLVLEDHAAATSAPEMHFTGYNGRAGDKKTFGIGIDIAQVTDATTNRAPFRDIVIFKFVTGGVVDGFYGKHRGGDLTPIWGFGNASIWETASLSYLLTVNPNLNEATMGGLLVLMPTANTTPAFCVQDAGGVERLKVAGSSGSYFLQGSHFLTGAAVCIKAPSGSNAVPLAFCDSAGANYWGWSYGAGNVSVRFRNIGSAVTAFEFWATAVQAQLPFSTTGTATIAGTFTAQAAAVLGGAANTLGFFGAAGNTKHAALPADATDLASAIALVNDIKNNVVKRYALAA